MPRPFGIILNIDQRMMDVFERNLRNRTNVSLLLIEILGLAEIKELNCFKSS